MRTISVAGRKYRISQTGSIYEEMDDAYVHIGRVSEHGTWTQLIARAQHYITNRDAAHG